MRLGYLVFELELQGAGKAVRTSKKLFKTHLSFVFSFIPSHPTSPENITRQSLQWNPQGRRKKGRPRTTWRRCVEEDMKRGGHSWGGLQKLAQDRDGWRAVICGLYSDTG